MPCYIIHHEGWYFEYSTVSDSPTTYGMTKDEFQAYYLDEYGRSGMEDLPKRLERAERLGCSALSPRPMTAEEAVRSNRAGYRENFLTLDEIIRIYCVEKRAPVKGEGTRPWHEVA